MIFLLIGKYVERNCVDQQPDLTNKSTMESQGGRVTGGGSKDAADGGEGAGGVARSGH